MKFPAIAAAPQPSTNGHFLSHMLSNRINHDDRHPDVLLHQPDRENGSLADCPSAFKNTKFLVC
jgi:hypothetical protein